MLKSERKPRASHSVVGAVSLFILNKPFNNVDLEGSALFKTTILATGWCYDGAMTTYQRLLLVCVFSIASLPHILNAQQSLLDGLGSMSNIDSVGNNVLDEALKDMEAGLSKFSLQTKPRFPNAGELTIVSLNDYTMNTVGAKVEWYVDDKLMSESANQRFIKVPAPALGESVTVKARFLFQSGRTAESSTILKPVQVDVVVEPETRVPTFYKGRPLAVQQSAIKAVAFVYTDQGTAPAKNLTYRWESGGKVVEGGNLYEGNSIRFEPPLRRSAELQLTVMDSAGTPIGGKTISIPIVSPEVSFYEMNPLRGQSTIAIRNNFFLSGGELSVRAEPYYLSPETYADSGRDIEWQVSGIKVQNTSNDPYILTLAKQGGTGNTYVNFRFRSLAKQAQVVEKAFRIQH
mgnify:FL=1